MKLESFNKGQEIQNKLNALKEDVKKIEYAIDHIIVGTDSNQVYHLTINYPSDYSKNIDIKTDSFFIELVITHFKYVINSEIAKLEKQFNEL